MMQFPAEAINSGAKARRKSWAPKDYVVAENDAYHLIAYGAVKFDYRLTPADSAAYDWELVHV